MAANSSSNPQATEANHSNRYCCSLSITGSQSISGWWQTISRQEDRWWGKGVLRAAMKFRQWSEVVAGPRWKTFIRRFNRSRSVNSVGRLSVPFRLNYDPQSYSLNFDEQNGQMDVEEYYSGSRDFSSRYAAVPKGGR